MGAASPRPASLLAQALDPAVSPPDDALSERILDAALAVASASGVRHLTMDEVARRAGVGRMTVYRRFGDRGRLVDGLIARETRRGLEQIAAELDPDADPRERMAQGFVAALRVAREHPLLLRFSQLEPEAFLAELNAPGDPAGALAREFLAQQIREGQRSGELRAGDAEAAAELLFRIGVSFVLMPKSTIAIEDDDVARELARNLIAPIVSA
jgi:AcrR family transcriptional regulator